MTHLLLVLRYIAEHPRIALQGIREFRLTWTTHYDSPEIESYDAGRELAHLLTFRRWDEGA